MKTRLLGVLTLGISVVCVLGQGTVNFNTRIVGSVDARVETAVSGVYASGEGYSAQLYAGPAGTSGENLVAVPGVTYFRTGAGAGYVVPLGEVAIPGIPGGEVAAIQLRVWANNGAAITSYEAAVGVSEWLASNVIEITLGGHGEPPVPPPDLVGLQAVQIMIPEPSSLALLALGLGLGVLGLLRRRR